MLDSPWGRLFENWEHLTPDANGFPDVGEAPADVTRAGMHAFKQSLGILGTCIKEAPEFASRRRHTEPKHGVRSRDERVHHSSESVDVEQIMKQIRQRILEKRGADYTEDQIRELASVRLEKFLDPEEPALGSARSVPQEPAGGASPSRRRSTPPYAFDDQTLFATHRGALRFMRKLLQPDPEAVLQPEHAATRCCTRRRSSTSTC